jgi:1-acyl-sn-glycerol-3-phosphate acyltransferase
VTLTLRIGAILALLLICLPAHMATRLSGRTSRWPARFLRGVGRIVGMRVSFEGEALPGPVLYLANHLSWLDIVLLGGNTGARFVAKVEINRWPLIGLLARQNRTIFIDREARGAVRAQLDVIAQAITEPQPVAIFPEGTVCEGHEVMPFRASLLGAVGPAAIVQPVAIDYGPMLSFVRWPKTEGTPQNAARLIGRPGRIPVTLRFLPPLEPGLDRKAIANAAQTAIAQALDASGTIPLPR